MSNGINIGTGSGIEISADSQESLHNRFKIYSPYGRVFADIRLITANKVRCRNISNLLCVVFVQHTGVNTAGKHLGTGVDTTKTHVLVKYILLL